MFERYFHRRKVELAPLTETLSVARARLGEKFPRMSLRRMSHLGLLIGSALQDVSPGSDDALVYATSFAETRALEDYLKSFPSASPLLFQTSIHPSAVQQVLIGRQQPLRSFWPMTGRQRLIESALLAAMLEPAKRTVLVGGEEKGTWMLENGMASDRAFAFALDLDRDSTGALGMVRCDTEVTTERASNVSDETVTLLQFAQALSAGKSLHWHNGTGSWSIEWS